MTDQPKTISNSLLIIVFGAVVIVVILVIGALAVLVPGNTTVITTIIAFATLAIPALLTLKVSLDSKAVSEENRHSIAASSAQQAQAGEEQAQIAKRTEEKVDGHLGGLMQRIELLEQKNASLEQAAALKSQARESATSDKDEILAALQPLLPPVEVAS